MLPNIIETYLFWASIIDSGNPFEAIDLVLVQRGYQ